MQTDDRCCSEFTPGGLSTIRMLALADRDDLASLDLLCKSQIQVNWLVVQRADGADDREATSDEQMCNMKLSPSSLVVYTLDCAVENDAGIVTIFSDWDSEHRFEVEFSTIVAFFCLNFSCYLQIAVARPEHKPRGLVVCFDPVHHLHSWQMTIAFIELYAIFDADLLVVPLSALLLELRQLLRTYEADDRVHVKPAVEVPAKLVGANFCLHSLYRLLQFGAKNFEFEDASKVLSRSLSFADCFYEHRHSSQWILSAAIDELLVPSANLPAALTELFARHPNAASFELAATSLVLRAGEGEKRRLLHVFVYI